MLLFGRILLTCLLSRERCDLIPKIPRSFVKSTWILAALYPGMRNPNVLTSSIKQPILSHHFPSTLCWTDCQPSRARTCTYRRICIPIQSCNFDIRENVSSHTTDSYNFLQSNSCTVFDHDFRMDDFSWGRCLSKVCFCQCVSAIWEQERTILLFVHVGCLRGGNCRSLLLNTVLPRSTESILPITVQR